MTYRPVVVFFETDLHTVECNACMHLCVEEYGDGAAKRVWDMARQHVRETGHDVWKRTERRWHIGPYRPEGQGANG